MLKWESLHFPFANLGAKGHQGLGKEFIHLQTSMCSIQWQGAASWGLRFERRGGLHLPEPNFPWGRRWRRQQIGRKISRSVNAWENDRVQWCDSAPKAIGFHVSEAFESGRPRPRRTRLPASLRRSWDCRWTLQQSLWRSWRPKHFANSASHLDEVTISFLLYCAYLKLAF